MYFICQNGIGISRSFWRIRVVQAEFIRGTNSTVNRAGTPVPHVARLVYMCRAVRQRDN